MKNTLKFLSIGFALVLLVVSQQMSGQQGVEAAVATLNEDTVKWISDGDGATGTANKVAAGTAVKYYTAAASTSDVAHFYVRDSTLNAEQSGQTIYTAEITSTTYGDEGDVTSAKDQNVPLNGDDDDCDSVTGMRCWESNSKFAGTDVVPGSLTIALASLTAASSSATEVVAAPGIAMTTPAGFYNVNEADGVFQWAAAQTIGIAAGKARIASYKFNIDDGYAASEWRAKVTSTSDTTGEWVAIEEVADVETEKIVVDGNYFMGRVAFSTDAASASVNSRNETVSDDADTGTEAISTPVVWVQDGDTITVTYYEACTKTSGSCTTAGAVIATATATADTGEPTVTDISPNDGTLTKDTSPAVSFTINDAGIGFDSNIANYGDHVNLQINGCQVLDSEISVTAHSTSSITYSYDLGGSVLWSAVAKDDDSDEATCSAPEKRTKADSGFNTDTSTVVVEDGSGSTVDLDRTITGKKIQWKIIATDDAGNSKTVDGDSLDLTLDGTAPSSTTLTAAKMWDPNKLDTASPPTAGVDVTDNSAIKITFTETVDRASVSPSDFQVSGTGVVDATISSVSFGGKQGATDTFVYLDLAADLAPNARPKVDLIGSVSDLAGNVWTAVGATDGKININTASDGVAPTISNVAIDDNKLDSLEKGIITFDSNEALTNTGSGATVEQCTCIYVSGGFEEEATGANDGSTRVDLALTTTTSGKVTVQQGTSPFNVDTGIFGIIVVGRDANTQYGRGGAIKVLGEDVSGSYTAEVAKDAKHWVQIDNWPLVNKNDQVDRDLRTVIFGATVNGAAKTATVSKIDWGPSGTANGEKIEVAVDVKILATDTVKFDYYYAGADNVIEVDKKAPTATLSPKDDTSTEDLRQRITVGYASEDEYAGDTHRTVTLLKATLKDPDDVTTDILGDMITSDNISFYYKPKADLALGQYTVTVDAEDDSGNSGSDQVFKFTVKEKSKTTIAMEAGWNLISIPGTPADTAINSVITNEEVTTVLTYDPTVPGGWLTAVRDGDSLVGTLATVDASRGYWIYQEDGDDIKTLIPGSTSGVQQVPPALSLAKGWNLVPMVSLNNTATKVEADDYFANITWNKAKGWNAKTETWFDVLKGQDVTDADEDGVLEYDSDGDGVNDAQDKTGTDDINDLVPGKGYWVFANVAGTLVP